MRILSQAVRAVALCLDLGKGEIQCGQPPPRCSPPPSSQGFGLASFAGPGFGRGTRKGREGKQNRGGGVPRHSPPPTHTHTSIKFKCLFWVPPEPSGLGWA